MKNFALVPFLLWLKSRGVPPGRIAATFAILYAGLRIPIDLFREYPSNTLGLPNGQTLNILMVVIGLVALLINLNRNHRKSKKPCESGDLPKLADREEENLLWRKTVLFAVCLIPLVVPSDATRDVPSTYGSRHPGMKHSVIYPNIAEDLDKAEKARKTRE